MSTVVVVAIARDAAAVASAVQQLQRLPGAVASSWGVTWNALSLDAVSFRVCDASRHTGLSLPQGESVRIVGVAAACSPAHVDSTDAELLQSLELAGSARSLSGALRGLGLGAPVAPVPRIRVFDGNGAREGRGRGGAGLAVKEVVLGCASDGGVALADAERALEQSGARRSTANLSVWTGGRAGLPAVRLLPSRYSSLVLGMRTTAVHGREELQEQLRIAGLDSVVHGRRMADESSGQLLFTHPALRGLDLRVCFAPYLTPFFSERTESYTDEVDTRMNPGRSDPRSSQSLACNSVMGMELIGVVRRQLGLEPAGTKLATLDKLIWKG
jgi:hypothetical protein